MRKILITGASGYVGAYLCKKLSKWGTDCVTALYNNSKVDFPNINYVKCDLTNLDKLSKIFDQAAPDIVYHLASVTPTRIGKKGNDYVEFFNHFITGHIAKLSKEHNSLLIYTSTDLVYNGGENITEDSMLNPKTVYAESKLNGEEVIESFAPKFVILRMSLVWGLTLNSYNTFFDTAYKALGSRSEINAFGDQYRHPIYVKDAAYNLLQIPVVYDGNIIMNFCGSDYLSRYEMIVRMAEVYGFDKKLIKKISCDEIPGNTCIKKIGLNNQIMNSYELYTYTYEENLYNSLKYRY